MEPRIIWGISTIFLLLIYPLILVVNVLSFFQGSHGQLTGSPLHQLAFQCFLWVSLSYPLSYSTAFFGNRLARQNNHPRCALWLSLIPPAHIFLTWIFFFLSFATERSAPTPLP